MIVFDLICGGGHRFEGWFGSAADFAAQKEQQQLSCPSCGNARVERVPSAARLNFGAVEPARQARSSVPEPSNAALDPARPQGKDPLALAQVLYSRMLDELLTKTEDVGKEFPAEARRIFYEEAPSRPIRGQATPEEHESLVEEGIPVLRLPVPSDRLN